MNTRDSKSGTCLKSEFPCMHCRQYMIGSPFIGGKDSQLISQDSSSRSTRGARYRQTQRESNEIHGNTFWKEVREPGER